MGLKLITAPSAEPVTLSDVKAQLPVLTGDTSQDAVITRRITEARQWVEEYLDRSLINQTWERALDQFADTIDLPKGPVSSVSSVKYLDPDGVEQTLAGTEYQLDDYGSPAWVMPAYGKSWPSTQSTINAVKVRYVAGYGAAGSSVPGPIKEAIMLIIGNWMNFQAGVEAGITITRVPWAAIDLLAPYRVVRFV